MTVDLDCELRSTTQERAIVRYVRHNLDNPEIRNHLTAGMQPTRLSMTFEDRLSFVLTENFEIKRLIFSDVLKEKMLEEEDYKDEDDRFNADFALMCGELKRFLPFLIESLGGEKG